MRRLVILSLMALLGACSVEVGGDPDNPPGGYEMQVFAQDDAQIYLVTGPDGERAAARVDNGASSVIDANEARLALGEARAAAADAGPPPDDQHVHISLPGFELSVAADEDEASDGLDRARIKIRAAGREVNVDAAGEDESGHAVVRISGASAEDARDFIDDAEDLSAETKQQMLSDLGLTAAQH